ncbi:hypothetical protein AX761_18050 [Rhizobium sp. 58]|nr:hypothetical protein AX761_18050 [Rhizobium sp. 58]
MSLVDDSLMGPIPTRSTKTAAHSSFGAGGKSAAFENAITDAGKKKAAAAALSVKDVQIEITKTDTGKTDIGKTDIGKSDAVKIGMEKGASDGDMALAGSSRDENALSNAGRTISGKARDAANTLAHQSSDLKDKAARTLQQEKASTFALLNRLASAKETAAIAAHPQAEGAAGNADAARATAADDDAKLASKLQDLPSLGKIAELVKDGKLVKATDDGQKAERSDAGKASDTGEGDATGLDVDATENGGLSQLLAMLGSPKQMSAAASAETPTTPTELISEFQALADRAGKARNDNRQTDTAGTARKAATDADSNAVANATAAGTDQTFRFARADGKGQSVSMSINTDGDKPSAKIDAAGSKAEAASSAKAETVTVLEARRYLGIAANTNSQAVAAAVTGSTEWARAMQPSSGLSSAEASSAAGKVVNTLKIQMNPIDLGMVTATLRLKDDELHVDLKVESGEAFRQLSDDQNAMVKALRAQGFAVDQINITFNAPTDASSGNAGSQQPQAGQQGRDASGEGTAQGRGRNDNSGQQQSGERYTGNDGTDEASAVSERGRADHTYM